MKYKIDVVRIREDSIMSDGWATRKSPGSRATFRIEDERHNLAKSKYVSIRGDDMSQIYFKKVHNKEFGFDIQFPYERGKSYYLFTHREGRQARIKCNGDLITHRAGVIHKQMEEIKDLMSMETVHVALDFWREHGLEALAVKFRHKLQGIDNDYDYSEWYELTRPTDEELVAQRQENLDFEPLLSVVIPTYKTPERYLREILDSILKQTYTNWEVCVVDGSSREQGLEWVPKKYADRNRCTRYGMLDSDRGIAGDTNTILDMARGDFVILADHGDILPPHAFYEVAKAISERPGCDVFYSNGDKLDTDGKVLFDPHLKPDFNPDLLVSVNYICHLPVVRQDLLKQVGGFRQKLDGTQNYGFTFHCTEATEHMHYIPKVPYRQRCYQDSTVSNPEGKVYAFKAGSRAIMAHYERLGIEVERMEKGVDHDIYHTRFKTQGEPLISVIIPSRDYSEDLDVCVKSPIERSIYRNSELVVVENNSREKETFAYYEKMQVLYSNFHVVTWEGESNRSAISNYGADFVKDQYLLLLNNDTELIDPDSIGEMLGFRQREDVGITGARLLYGNDAIRRAGVIIGLGGIARHTLIGLHKAENSYFHRAMYAQDYSAVVAAYLMTKKDIFDAVGGLNTESAVAFNDIGRYMKIRALGKLVVCAPYAYFYHYGSKSRRLEGISEKVERFSREIAIFIKEWPDIIKNGDPYYNPNLTLRKSNSASRDLLEEKIGEPYDLRVYQQHAPEDKQNPHE